MLILPPGHAETLRLRRLTSRERWLIRAVAATVIVAVAAVSISLASSGPSSARGCIYATIPAATGAQQISECGSTARATCAAVREPGAFTRQAAETVAAACRKAGLPAGR